MNSIVSAMQTLAANVVPPVLTAASVLAGMVLIMKALLAMTRAADNGGRGGPNDSGWGGIGASLLIGALLLQFSATMNDIVSLLFSAPPQNYRNALAYMPISGGGSNYWKTVLDVCLMWVVVLGWVAAFRGLLKWNAAANGAQSSSGGDLFWQGLWHIVGGAMAINIGGLAGSLLGN